MPPGRRVTLIQDFLGSTQVFASAVNDVVEKKLLRQVAGSQLTLPQFKLLKLVALTDAHTVGDAALFLGVSNAAASKAVDRLVRRKLLRRREGEPDRRAVHLSLSPTGQQLLAAYDAAKNRKLARVFARFTRAELRRAAELLDRLAAGIVNHHAHPEEVCLQCGIYFRQGCLVRQLIGRRCFYHLHKSQPEEAPDRSENGPRRKRAQPAAG